MSTVLSLHGDGDMNKVPTSKRERGEGIIGKVEGGSNKVRGKTLVLTSDGFSLEPNKRISDYMDEIRPEHPDLDETEILKLALDKQRREDLIARMKQQDELNAVLEHLGLKHETRHMNIAAMAPKGSLEAFMLAQQRANDKAKCN